MLRRSLLAAPLVLAATPSRAQQWVPKQPIKILVGYAPGFFFNDAGQNQGVIGRAQRAVGRAQGPGCVQLLLHGLGSLAQHGATMAIHLGVNHLQKIITELLPHYGSDCPIAVIHRATWPDQDWVVGTLEDIAAKVEAKGFRRTALILVGRVLGSDQFSESSLYRAGHAHLYRP